MGKGREKRKGRKGCAGMKKDELAHGFSKDCILQGKFKRGGKKKVLEMSKCAEVKQCLGNSVLLKMLSAERGT